MADGARVGEFTEKVADTALPACRSARSRPPNFPRPHGSVSKCGHARRSALDARAIILGDVPANLQPDGLGAVGESVVLSPGSTVRQQLFDST